ncbi:MAG: hypothetical protein K8R58_00200 [Bacteroidales bacterium]|nr:hypothetical protein [Bacteroidales bacterium]
MTILLLIILIIIYLLIGETENQLVINIVSLSSTIIVNIIAAIFWYTMIQGSIYFERNRPLSNAFPFTKNNNEKVFIILSSIPSSTGHKLTGMGEAKALGMILEMFRSVDFPMTNVETNFDDYYSSDDLNNIIENENVILIGGPNFNIATRLFFDENHNSLPYVFKENTDVDSVRNNKNKDKYFSPSIIWNSTKPRTITEPVPSNPKNDSEVKKDCGLVIRKTNQAGKSITVLAGGMTPGVWIAAWLMTDQVKITEWYTKLNSNDINKFEIIFESTIQGILSTELNRIKILNIQGLIK